MAKDDKKRVVSILDHCGKPKTFVISLKYIEETSHSIVALTEITNIDREKKKFETRAYTDKLTKIPNRAYFEEEFRKEIARYKREKTPLSFIIFDIDKFKDFNDNYGHQMGDDILRDLAKIVKKTTRQTDTLARWGGEEFVEILPNTALLNAKKVAEHLRETIEEYSFQDDLKVTCSFGVAEFNDIDDTQQSVMKRADDALYRAKASGRNRVEG